MLRDHCIFYWWEMRGIPTLMVRKEIRAWWIILREVGWFLLHWLNSGVSIWLCRHVLDKQALVDNGDWKNALILSICFESMKMSDCSMWEFKRTVRFTNTFWLGSFMKKNDTSKELVYVIKHSSYFREVGHICKGRIYIWERQFQLRVELQCRYKCLGLEIVCIL